MKEDCHLSVAVRLDILEENVIYKEEKDDEFLDVR